MKHLIRTFGSIAILAVMAIALLSPLPALGKSDCDATVNAELERQDSDAGVTHLQFSVEITSAEPCAHIEYDLVLVVILPNSQLNRVRITREVKLDDGSLSEIVEHEMDSSIQLQSFEAKIFECRKCVLEP
jgi:hypothetical protein